MLTYIVVVVTGMWLLVGRELPVAHAVLSEHCQNEKFTARCNIGHVIVMKTAVYGRMRVSQCVERDYGYVGCSEDVLGYADSMCSGIRECEIPVPNSLFDAAKPCPNDLKSYFQAEYDCVKVITVPEAICRTSIMVDVTAPSGEISSYVTDETELGSANCPWVIKAKPGQRINMTLLDFSTNMDLDGGSCQAYAIVREKEPMHSYTICRGGIRERQVYLSQGNKLEVRVVRPKNGKGRHFILKYEMIGCGDPEVPDGGWLKRYDNEAEMGCQDAAKPIWRLKCERNRWIGTLRNCTRGGSAEGVFGNVSWGNHAMPFGSSMVLVVAIALTLGLIILIAGLSILKCRRRTPLPNGALQDHQYQTTYKLPGSVGSRPVQVGVDQESLYQAPENEYAYISDFQPTNDTQAQNLSIRHMELYKARKCYDYGSAKPPQQVPQENKMASKHRQVSSAEKPQGGKSKPEVQERYVEKTERRATDLPPTYFELDPDENKADGARRERKPANNNCSVGAHGVENSAIKRVNQSTYDFNPAAYDQLMDTPGNNNHKSV